MRNRYYVIVNGAVEFENNWMDYVKAYLISHGLTVYRFTFQENTIVLEAR